MQIRKVLALRGPNIWSRTPALEVWVDLGPLKDTSSEQMPGFNDRLMAWLPTLIEHRCSVGERGGFYQRLRRGTYLAHILEHVTLELQTLAGTPVGFGRARETSQEGLYKVAIRYQEEVLARACLESAQQLLLAAVYGREFAIDTELRRLRELADRVCLGPSTAAIVEAAKARNIPYRRLNSGSLVQLGQGHRQRRIWTAETDNTSAIAESIAQDKDLTKQLLKAAGIPVPEGRAVDSPEDAWDAAQEIEGTVVVKPQDANHGRGVFMDLSERSEIEFAYHEAIKEGSGVLVERFCPGREHRLLVVGGKLVAATCGEACAVIGDAETSIARLIELQINSDPRRGDDETCPLNPVLLDAMTLAVLGRQGYTPESVPEAGVRVLVRRNDNLSHDVTDEVHTSVREHSELAAAVVGLDIAGIDLVVEDISQPLESQGGAIVEVNAGPGLLPHLKPQVGRPRPVGEAILSTLFPGDDTGRIPIVCVTGTNGKTTTSRLIAHILRQVGHSVGLACSDGVWVAGRAIDLGDCAGPASARSILLNPLVTAAVCEAGRGGILREGLGFDKCDIAVVTNIGSADHLGQADLHTPEDMFKVKRTPVDVVLPTGTAVLNAADPLVLEMAELSAGGATLFGLQADLPALQAQRDQGKRWVSVRAGRILLGSGKSETSLMPLQDIPCTHGGRVGFQVENVLAAVAACWALNVPVEVVQAGLQSFQGNLEDDPGRFNVFEVAGKTLVVIDARNASALQALLTALEQFPHEQRSIVYGVEEDRREVDLQAQAELLAAGFDRVYVCEHAHPDVVEGSMAERLVEALQGGPRVREVRCIRNWGQAAEQAWADLPRGSLLVLQTGSIPQTVRKVKGLVGLEPAETRSLASGTPIATGP